jgi:hypothetical protein
VLAGYNALVRRAGRIPLLWRLRPYPHVSGELTKTPSATLGLRPGERVRVKPKAEILATLSTGQRNRGLWFDAEMVPFCGREFRVLRRVERIIDDRTGRMLELRGDCIILDGAVCGGHLSRNRLFCPRSIYSYWREIWLERVEDQPDGTPAAESRQPAARLPSAPTTAAGPTRGGEAFDR